MEKTHLREDLRRLNDPISMPRWVLPAKYLFFIMLAASTFVSGLRTLDLTTPATYTPIWCLAIAVGSIVALPASVTIRGEHVERWAAAWVAGWLSVVAFNSFFVSTGAGWLFVAFVTFVPAGRAVYLFSRRDK